MYCFLELLYHKSGFFTFEHYLLQTEVENRYKMFLNDFPHSTPSDIDIIQWVDEAFTTLQLNMKVKAANTDNIVFGFI